MITERWNISFTNMIRLTNQAAWGNWTLNPSVQSGAVGIIDPVSGSFTSVSKMPDAKIIDLEAPEEWVVESSSVRKTQGEVKFEGGYKDPSTGKNVDVGLEVEWAFSREGSIVSNATKTGRSVVNDFGTLMGEKFDWLYEQAHSLGQTFDGGIVQGFGMITHVEHCIGGINIGALNEDSSFSITGSVDGVNAMTGGGSVNAGIKGSYKETNQTKAFESHMWPASADLPVEDNIGISYQFASYDGKLIMPRWIGPLSGLTVVFDNAHHGTYIGHCTVAYEPPGGGPKQTQTTSVPGGQVHTIDGIPLGATKLTIDIDFTAGSDFHFQWPVPTATWLSGQRTIDMSGVWPWGSYAEVRETNPSI